MYVYYTRSFVYTIRTEDGRTEHDQRAMNKRIQELQKFVWLDRERRKINMIEGRSCGVVVVEHKT